MPESDAAEPSRAEASAVSSCARAAPRRRRNAPSSSTAANTDWHYTGEAKDFSSVFPHAGDLVVEIGFGNGEQLLFAAENEPQRNFIGIEVHPPGVGRALNGIGQRGLENVRVYQHDAVEVLQHEIADASLSEVRVYFPDPWHKKRHHKRRIIQPDFVQLLCRKLKPGGLLHLASDWREYVEHMWEVCDNEPLLRNNQGPAGSAARPCMAAADALRDARTESGPWRLGFAVHPARGALNRCKATWP